MIVDREKMPCALGDKPCALTPSTRASTVQPRCGTCSSASSRIALRNPREMRQHAAIMPAQHHCFHRTARLDTRLRTHPPAQCGIPRVPVLPFLLLAVAAVAESTARSRPCDAGGVRQHTRGTARLADRSAIARGFECDATGNVRLIPASRACESLLIVEQAWT